MRADERLDLADLSLSTEFARPREYDGRGERIVAMRFKPHQLEGWGRTKQLWLKLPTHPNILEALEGNDDGSLLVRYAAIDWGHGAIRLDDAQSLDRVATWGAQLAGALEFVVANTPVEHAAWLSRIEVHVDLGASIRIGFLPASPTETMASDRWPAEVLQMWPACDQRGFVCLVGRLLSSMFVRSDGERARRLNAVVERCLAPSPKHRFSTLADLRDAFVDVGGKAMVRTRLWWDHIELGLGLLAIREPERAIPHFETALEIDRYGWIAYAGIQRARLSLAGLSLPALPGYQALRSWDETESEGRKLEADRAFAPALELYQRTRRDGTCDVPLLVATARCHLQLGEAAPAIDFAQRALAVDPSCTAAMAIRVNGLLLAKDFEAAVKASDVWLGIGIDQAAAHYGRGKALLALRRLAEARDAFDRALAADPRLVPAMLLRREADRLLKSVRDATGVQRPVEIDVPAHLPELKPLFTGGRIAEAITLLAGDAYAEDSRAQLVRASCLDFAGQFAEAAEIYQRIASRDPEHRHAALLGRAQMLVELGDPEVALELFDVLRAKRPEDLDVIEGRAWVLDRLGRTDDAKAEFRRYVALNQGRSDRRLRTTSRR